MPLPTTPRLAFAALALTTLLPAAQADPGYYVVTPYPDAGAVSGELRYWSVKPNGRPEVIWPEVGVGWGVTSRWTTVLFASWIGSSRFPTRLSSWNWQNTVLLTQGEWPVDVGVHAQWIAVRGNGHALEFGPMLQADLGRTQLNLNLIADHLRYRREPRRTELKLQWQARHRWQRGFHVGLQGFSELGPIDDDVPGTARSHRAGPALFGTLRPSPDLRVELQGGLLLGRTNGRSGRMVTLLMRVVAP